MKPEKHRPNRGASDERFRLLSNALERLGAAYTHTAILDVIRTFARQLVGAEGVSIVLRQNDQCYYAHAECRVGPLWEGQSFPMISCVSGWAMLHRQTAVIENIYDDDRVPRELYEPTCIRSMVMVPVGGKEPCAAIGVYWTEVCKPDPEAIAVLETLARASGVALDRCSAEESVRASEERYRSLFESIGEGFCLVEVLPVESGNPPDCRILEANPAFEQQSGLHCRAGMTLREFAPNADGHEIAYYVDVAATGVPARFDTCVEALDKWFSVYAYRVGEPAARRVAILFTDITQQKRTQHELEIANERLNLAIEGVGDGVWEWDIVNNVSRLSRRTKEIAGYGDDELSANRDDWIGRIHPDDRPRADTTLQACLKGLTPSYFCEYRLRCKDGSWKWVLSRGIVVTRDADNRPLRMTGMVTDISERKQADERVWQHANFDALTGLPNRRLFRDRLEQEVRKAQRNGHLIALLFIDLDRFKQVNDLLGHDAGDLLLVQAGQRIRGCVRDTDTVARLGGDEFTVILSELESMDHVECLSQKILETLGKPFCLGKEVAYVSGSVGVTLYPADAATPEELIRKADLAMYTAKNAGRNCFSYFTQSMDEKAHRRLRLSGALRNALQGGEFEVYYQPVIDLNDDRIVKAEALLRWHHPDLGWIEPSSFIPLAEESDMIVEIGNWVFRQAAGCSRRWGNRLGMPFQISVNKSPVQFLSRPEKEDWLQHLQHLGLPGKCIVVEITEGLLLHASVTVTDKLLEYRDAGIQVAIDDFGTGYSSMAYLKKFDIDYLKIDRSFVCDIGADADSRTIAESMIVMAHRLGLKVIAEGIETVEQRDLLRAAGCDYGQGFLFSPPLPAAQFERLFVDRMAGLQTAVH
jgi:diguanylate cyclase (GGDEF)-like protein/PAS domain S-box-containing protein